MKIAFVSDVVFPYNKSGRSRRLYEIAKRLAKKHEVHIYTMKWWDGPKNITENKIHLHAVCRFRPLWMGNRRSIGQALYFARRLFIPLLCSDFDIIDCDQFPHFPCYTAKIVSVLKEKPMVISWHEVWGRYWNEYLGSLGYIARAVEWITAKLTKYNIANSYATKRKLENIAKNPAKLITPGTIIQESAKKRKGILYVGRLAAEKNLDMLLKSARILKREGIPLTVIGYGPDESRIKKLARSYGLNISFLGNVPDKILCRELKENKFFVSASTREGFSIAALEAMGSGMPPIVINHPNNAADEIVPKELIVSLNANEIAEKILNMDSRKYRIFSRKVRNIARKYTWQKAVETYEQYLDTVLFLNKLRQ
jgi:glycosyltransferase involved in cell wall biosynthesis